jgi:predicted nucleotidyltransferase
MIDGFLEQLKRACGEKLKSVVLYGSRATDDMVSQTSDYNVLVVLDDVTTVVLKAMSGPVRRWVARGNPPPLVFTRDRLQTSFDVFPVEFSDMIAARKVLYGEDPFDGVVVRDQHLRHECEYVLKSLLLRLRQGYMAAGGNPRRVKNLMTGSVSSVVTVLRYVVLLLGGPATAQKTEVLDQASKRVSVDRRVFDTVFGIKQGTVRLSARDLDGLMAGYLAEIERVVDAVDNLGENESFS